MELVAIVDRPRPPEDVAGPPPGATRTSSGLAYRVLRSGTGRERPTAEARVDVQYSAWTTDGKMIDSSVVGEKARFWLPPAKTRGERVGPARSARGVAYEGTLVFDVELVAIR
jgi:FKBP-type peptidyl-prolyl cis-trans isomerase